MNLKTSYKHQKWRENEEFLTPFSSNGHNYPLIRLRSFQKFVSQHIISRFINPIWNNARVIPIERMVIPFIDRVINPKICSMRHRTFNFSRFEAFCASVRGCDFYTLFRKCDFRNLTADYSQFRHLNKHCQHIALCLLFQVILCTFDCHAVQHRLLRSLLSVYCRHRI